MDEIRESKYLSLVLRHKPELLGLTLDDHGWVSVDALLAVMHKEGRNLTRENLETIVRNDDKQRFAFSDDGARIRANQGHSVRVDLGLEPSEPPATLFHGTTTRFLENIREEGLVSRSRQHVHLHEDKSVATTVGSRHGRPVVLIVRAADMFAEGRDFFLSENNVWLTESVPAQFIEEAQDD